MHPRRRPISPLRSFTLIELLIVIGIISLLIAVSVLVGVKVVGSGKQRSTEGALKALDSALSGLMQNGRLKTCYYRKSTGAPGSAQSMLFPIVDGRWKDRTLPNDPGDPSGLSDPQARFDLTYDPAQPSLTLLILAHDELGAAVQQLNPKYVSRRTIVAYGWPVDQNGKVNGPLTAGLIEGPVVTDGWGNPVRVCVPQFQGGSGDYFKPNPPPGTGGTMVTNRPMTRVYPAAEFATGAVTFADFSRSYRPFDPGPPPVVQCKNPVGDCDEGICNGNRPYFYSCGADGDPGTRADNVFAFSPPRYAEETLSYP